MFTYGDAMNLNAIIGFEQTREVVEEVADLDDGFIGGGRIDFPIAR